MAIKDLIVRAKPYYACFIAQELAKSPSRTVDDLRQASARQDSFGEVSYLLEDDETISQALVFLEDSNIARYVPDEFGPDIIIRGTNFSENLSALQTQHGSVFEKFNLAGDGRNNWLSAALKGVNSHIQLTRAQTEPLAHSEDQDAWTPIPLDRNDLQQRQAAEALDRVVEELRGDNGYASTNLEEKAFVRDKLSSVTKRLREDTQISWMYLLEFALKPLGIIIKRFGGAALGITAVTAKDALTSWLKTKGISVLDDFFK